MENKNPFGIKIYGNNIYTINGISFRVNSISVSSDDKHFFIYRYINKKIYGIKIYKLNKVVW